MLYVKILRRVTLSRTRVLDPHTFFFPFELFSLMSLPRFIGLIQYRRGGKRSKNLFFFLGVRVGTFGLLTVCYRCCH